MKAMTPARIARAVGGRHIPPPGGAAQPAITAVSTDSRTAAAGELFVAITGANFDAHDFLPQAADAGCAAAVVATRASVPDDLAALFPAGLIAVADTTRALGDLAAHSRRAGRAKVIAVTGSNGKTTVKLMIRHILSRRLRGTAGPKSFNNQIGVPLTLLAAGGNDDYVVCEIGTNAPGEAAALARIAAPDVAVITSVAASHLERLGSVEQVAVEKASILDHLVAGGLAMVTADSEPLDRALRGYDAHFVRFGTSDGAQFRMTGYEPAGVGARFELNGRAWVSLPLPGRHNALNALAALAVADHFEIAPAEAGEALADFTAPPMRLERIELGDVTIINDAYNANPASMVAAADVLAEQESQRRVMVVGDMLELGAAAEALHTHAGAEIAARGVDLLVCVGRLGRYIALGAAEAGLEAVAFDTRDQAADELPRMLRCGDVVLVKGSRAMGMEKLVESVRAALAAR